MKIGLIADSHDHRENIEKAISVFKSQKVSLVIHLGDYVNPGSVKLFKGLKLGGLKFAIYHGTEPSITDALTNCCKYDVVAYGHTRTFPPSSRRYT